MIKLIGLGLHDEKDLSLKAIEEVKNSDRVFIEFYTGKWPGNLQNLEKIIGKKAEILSRSDLEENSAKILEIAKNQTISILSQGDPLVFTTHSTLLTEAKRIGIKTRIIHGSSIFSAVAESGLHLYRFGGSATVPFPEKTSGQLPESVYEVIKSNKKIGLHTLLLMDISDGKNLLPNEAIQTLLKMENLRKEGVLTLDTNLVILTDVGGDESKVFYGRASECLQRNFGDLNSVIIVPGNLH